MGIRPTAIYLAGPMLDHTGDYRHRDAQTWREKLAEDGPAGVLFFSPAHAFFGAGPATAEMVDYIERSVIFACQATIAYCPDDEPLFGTIRDIEFAHSHGRVVVVVSKTKSLMTWDLIVVQTLDEAVPAVLEAVNDRRLSERVPQIFGLRLGRPPGDDDDPDSA